MRVCQKAALRGSQKWMQLLVNKAPHLLDRALARELSLAPSDKITWHSPLVGDGYAEYRDRTFLAKVDAQPRNMPLSSFWPARGPQWDALARTSRGDILLIEAKAHIPELLSTACQAAGKSLSTIKASLGRVKRALGSRGSADWCSMYYQYTNRLAHLYFLRTLNGIPAYLVFLYLIGDKTMFGPKTAEEWSGALRLVHTALGIDEVRLRQSFGHAVVEIFLDVADIEAAII
jgi:hypothetical protein